MDKNVKTRHIGSVLRGSKKKTIKPQACRAETKKKKK